MESVHKLSKKVFLNWEQCIKYDIIIWKILADIFIFDVN